MTDSDRAILAGIKSMENDAPNVGLCPLTFQILYAEVLELMKERDLALENAK